MSESRTLDGPSKASGMSGAGVTVATAPTALSLSKPALRVAAVRQWLTLSASSAFGLGYAPKAPGTFGTLAGLPLWYWLSGQAPWAWALFVLAFCAASVAVASAAERIYGAHDVQRIVIDEVAGLLVTSLAVPFSWRTALVAFVVFRVFDITKPLPIRWVDQRVAGGFGVVLDDVMAGAFGCALLHAGRWAFGSW